jgi:hypothetical protein
VSGLQQEPPLPSSKFGQHRVFRRFLEGQEPACSPDASLQQLDEAGMHLPAQHFLPCSLQSAPPFPAQPPQWL